MLNHSHKKHTMKLFINIAGNTEKCIEQIYFIFINFSISIFSFHDIQQKKSVNMKCKDLECWDERNREFDLSSCVFILDYFLMKIIY